MFQDDDGVLKVQYADICQENESRQAEFKRMQRMKDNFYDFDYYNFD